MSGAILIVTHNNLHLTKKAVLSALRQTVPCYVLIVDNGSTDSTVRWLISRRLRALDEGSYCGVIVPPHQLSLAACWNLGLESLFKGGMDKVLVLNNDVEIRLHSYEILASYMDWSPSQEGLVSLTAVDRREDVPQSIEEDFTLADFHALRIPHPDFSAFMIRRETYQTVGPFDEEYFPCYVEDCDFHVRMHRAGILATKIPLPFFHARSSTMANASAEERQMIEQGALRNRDRFRELYGCLPGTPDYDRLFDEKSDFTT